MYRKLSLALLASVAILPSTAHAEIGSVAAVNRDMNGTPPAGSPRALDLGNRVVKDELIQTSQLGSGQLMFLDQTTLTIAPGSDIVLDEYVYDADRQAGDMALSITRGTLRVIGGRITKKTDAIITTPTATVGIRGGLAIVEVDENGDTKVILIAGEYAKITSPDGQVIYLSRPNAWADVTRASGLQFAGLIPPEELEALYRKFEGKGDGGISNAASAAALVLVDEFAPQLNNADEKNGHRRKPVSTSGENPEDDRTEGDNEQGDGIFDDLVDPVATNPEPPQIEEPTPVDPTLPAAGAFAASGLGHTGFDNIAQGSLIGQSGGTVVVEAIVPTTPTQLTRGFGINESTFDAIGTRDTAGFTSFTIGDDGASDPETDEVLLPEAVLPVLAGDLSELNYFGFSDLDENFHLFQFEANFADPAIPNKEGQFFFGNASPNQAVLGPDLAQADNSANTASSYIIEPNLRDFAPTLPGDELLVIANGGESRFQGTGSFDPSGLFSVGGGRVGEKPGSEAGTEPSTGPSTGVIVVEPVPGSGVDVVSVVNLSLDSVESNGGQVLSAGAELEEFGSAGFVFQESSFQVFAEPIAENSLSFGGSSFGTFFDGESFGYREQNFGTLEDVEGNTVFGTGDNYIIVSSFFRQDGDPANAYSEDPGDVTLLGIDTFDLDLSQNLLTLDTKRDQIVADPLALVESQAAGFPTRDDGFINNDAFAVFNAGITLCSDFGCGEFIPDFDSNSGFYGQRTVNQQLGELTFHTGQVTGGDDNGLFFRLRARSTADSGIPGTDGENRANFTYGRGVETSDSSGAYLNDAVFGLSESGVEINTNARGASGDVVGNLALASSGAAGTAGLINDSDQPDFLRWGFWSAQYDIDTDREDLVHMGTFVAGALPNINELPDDGTAFYAGIAVGTDANPEAGPPILVSGTFNLNYDFGAGQGQFDMNIAGFNFENAFTRGLSSDPRQYTVSDFRDDASLRADGAFVAAGQVPNAATIGSFQIDDNDIENRQIIGVFGGDQPPG